MKSYWGWIKADMQDSGAARRCGWRAEGFMMKAQLRVFLAATAVFSCVPRSCVRVPARGGGAVSTRTSKGSRCLLPYYAVARPGWLWWQWLTLEKEELAEIPLVKDRRQFTWFMYNLCHTFILKILSFTFWYLIFYLLWCLFLELSWGEAVAKITTYFYHFILGHSNALSHMLYYPIITF